MQKLCVLDSISVQIDCTIDCVLPIAITIKASVRDVYGRVVQDLSVVNVLRTATHTLFSLCSQLALPKGEHLANVLFMHGDVVCASDVFTLSVSPSPTQVV